MQEISNYFEKPFKLINAFKKRFEISHPGATIRINLRVLYRKKHNF